MNPKQFLVIGGIALLVLGFGGFLGLIGPTPSQSIFGDFWWFDTPENIAHTVLGVAGLAAVFIFPSLWQKYLVVLLGVLGVVVGLYNLMSTSLLGANLESPADMLLHLVVGGWALYAGLMGSKKASA